MKSFNATCCSLVLCCLLGGATVATSVAAAPTDLSELLVPPGRFANLDTHRLYYHCIGTGTPTVVIDNGIGGAALEWTQVQNLIAKTTRVCTYDRAGYGWSDTGPGPRTTPRAVDELRRVLDLAGERGPWVLVGHSYGGFNVRYFAARYPENVAGLVLVDSSHPDEPVRRAGEIAARRNAIDPTRVTTYREEEDPFVAAAGFLNSRRKAIFAQMDELANFEISAQAVASAGRLPSIPLTIISRDESEGHDAAVEARWAELQGSLSALTSDSRRVIAPHSEHRIYIDVPELVAVEIVRVVKHAREDGRERGD